MRALLKKGAAEPYSFDFSLEELDLICNSLRRNLAEKKSVLDSLLWLDRPLAGFKKEVAEIAELLNKIDELKISQ